MFEIGNSLRAARIRQKLELSQAEGDTRIRAKYLRALEDERFEVLPGPAYTKGFLRTYADYLGLDGQRFAQEYNSRLASEEEPPAPPQLRIRRRHRFVLAPRLLAVAVLAAGIAVIAWRLSSNGGHHPTAAPPPAQTGTTKPRPLRPGSRWRSLGSCWWLGEVAVGSQCTMARRPADWSTRGRSSRVEPLTSFRRDSGSGSGPRGTWTQP